MFLLNSVARLAAAITIVLAGVVSAPSTTNAARVCGLTEFSETVIGGSANLSEAFGIIPEFIAQVGIGPGSAVTKFRIAGSPLPRQTAYGSSTLYSRFICGDSSTPVKFVFGPADYRDSYQWLITWRPDGNHEAHLGELCPTGSSRSLGSYERRTSANTVVSENYCDRNPKIYTDGRLCFGVAGAPGDVAVVNLTPTAANGGGFGVLVSSDVPEPPNASNVNFNIGTLDPNVALAPIGADGKVCYENSTLASVHLIADHLGTIKSNAFALATTSGAPDRKIDTRNGPQVAPGGRLCFGVAGAPGDVAVVNLTPTAANGGGFGVLVSSDVPEPPNASNVNFNIGTLVPNVALAPIGADGKVCYENSTLASVHLIADHLGTIKSNAFALATTSGAPDRKIDTR